VELPAFPWENVTVVYWIRLATANIPRQKIDASIVTCNCSPCAAAPPLRRPALFSHEPFHYVSQQGGVELSECPLWVKSGHSPTVGPTSALRQ